MTSDDWLEITSRLAVGAIPEIGAGERAAPPVSGPRPCRESGDPRGPADSAGLSKPPTGRIWTLADPAPARFGVRVRHAPEDVRPIAARLVAAATERGACPVILSHVDRSGFEQLGFRVERVHAGSRHEAQMQEDELAAFWSLAIIVDLDDVDKFS